MNSLKEQLLEALDINEKLRLKDARLYTNMQGLREENVVEMQKYFYDRILELHKDAFLSRNGYRLYLPYTLDKKEEMSKNEQLSKIEKEVMLTLKENGYYTKSKEDYITNKCYKKVITQRGEKETQYNIGKVLNKLDKKIKTAYDSDPNRDRSTNDNKCYLCFSTHGYDIAGMSTDRSWTSCMNIINGENKEFVSKDVIHGTVICYLIDDTDKNINAPLSRILLKPRYLRANNGENLYILYPEVSAYGLRGYLAESLIIFLEHLCEKVYENYSGALKNKTGLYNDLYNRSKEPTKYLNFHTNQNEIIVATDENINELVKAAIHKYGNNADLNFIDVSNVTNMNYLFAYGKFNGDISKWNVSNVTNMSNMFYESIFNGDISNWNVSNVTSMSEIFNGSIFTGDISNWNVSNVEDMSYMFFNSEFNRDLSKWDVSNVKDMNGVFKHSKFNGDISKWNVGNVRDMSYMFEYSNFNGNISNWNTSNVETMTAMFANSKFNGDISKWNVSNVTNMSYMFFDSKFNRDISKWNVGNVEDMSYMFEESQFDGDISNWNVSKVRNHRNFCEDGPLEKKPARQPNFR